MLKTAPIQTADFSSLSAPETGYPDVVLAEVKPGLYDSLFTNLGSATDAQQARLAEMSTYLTVAGSWNALNRQVGGNVNLFKAELNNFDAVNTELLNFLNSNDRNYGDLSNRDRRQVNGIIQSWTAAESKTLELQQAVNQQLEGLKAVANDVSVDAKELGRFLTDEAKMDVNFNVSETRKVLTAAQGVDPQWNAVGRRYKSVYNMLQSRGYFQQ